LGFLGCAHTGLQANSWDKKNSRFSFDLIYGFKGQKTTDWCKTLEKALSFSPRHLSRYRLTYEPGTAFFEGGSYL
jgi:oxygen-independent coproporphyrinogen-3 oxidase